MRLVLDLMGGDHAPRAPLEGVAQTYRELLASGCELFLVGDVEKITPLLRQSRFRLLARAIESDRIHLVHAAETIAMDDSIRAVRRKPDASINVGLGLVAESQGRGTASSSGSHQTAFISAGHSGAVMTSALLKLGRVPGVERPAIAVRLPTLTDFKTGALGCILLDVGANVDCKPEHLRDFAVLGSLFAASQQQPVTRRKKQAPARKLPRVGLLSNGHEASKGNELTRNAMELIRNLPAFAPGSPTAIGEFVGYVEGKDLFRGKVDVAVTDGFLGNILLKSLEGMGMAIVTRFRQEARHSLLTRLGFLLQAPAYFRLRARVNYVEYGTAPLLGVNGHAFVCHGRSTGKAFARSLLRARDAVRSGYLDQIGPALVNNSAQV